MATDRTIYNLLPIPLLILCLLYVMLAGMAVKHFYKFTQVKYIGMLGKLFYGLLFLECFTRTTLFILLGVASMGGLEDNSTESGYFFGINMIFIPEFLLWISCTLLFWQYLITFYIAHINFSMNSRTKDVLPVPLRAKSFNIMIGMIIVFIIVQSTFVVLFNTDIFDSDILFLEDMIMNYALPVIAIITQFVLHLKFSGAPYVSINYMEKKKTMTRIIIYWIIARIFKATFTLILFAFHADIINDLTEDQKNNKSDQSIQLLEIIIFFINYFFAEVVAFSLTLNKSVVKIFQLYQYSNPFNDGKAFLLQDDANPLEQNPNKAYDEEENVERHSVNIQNFFQNLDLTKLSYENNAVVSNVSLNANFYLMFLFNLSSCQQFGASSSWNHDHLHCL